MTNPSSMLAIKGLIFTLATFGLAPTAHADDEPCFTSKPPGDGAFYEGDAASYMYDELFSGTKIVLKHLDTHIPQGAATWSNYDGKKDAILVTAYTKDKDKLPYIMAFEPKTGKHLGTAAVTTEHSSDEIASNHAGGIAVFEEQGWAYMSGPTAKITKDGPAEATVVKLSLEKLKAAIERNGKIDPETEDVVTFSSFLTSHGPTDTLFVGEFNDAGMGSMEAYKVAGDGTLTALPDRWDVPKKAQGVVVRKDIFVYSTSLGNDNRSNIYVVKRGKNETDLSKATFYCFRAPSMAEGLTVYGDYVLLVYESAADYYKAKKPRNVISNAHKASLARLEQFIP